MSVLLNPYLGFASEAREALGFYHAVFGGDLTIGTFGESGMPHDPADADKVLHGQLTGENGIVLMGSDSPSGMRVTRGSSVSISLSGDDDAALRRYWDGLSEGATVIEPLTTAPWGDTFGMLTDRWGTTWLVNVSGSVD